MAWSLKPLLEWLDDELDAALVKLQWLVKDMWAAVLAAGIHYFEGSTGDIMQFVKVMFTIRLLKLPLDMWMWLQTDGVQWMKQLNEKATWLERRVMMQDSLRSMRDLEDIARMRVRQSRD